MCCSPVTGHCLLGKRVLHFMAHHWWLLFVAAGAAAAAVCCLCEQLHTGFCSLDAVVCGLELENCAAFLKEAASSRSVRQHLWFQVVVMKRP